VAREQTNPKDPHWSHYHALAKTSSRTILCYEWLCPDCRTTNTTSIDPSSNRDKRRCFRGLEARCGKCHGNVHRLTDKKGLTIDPFE